MPKFFKQNLLSNPLDPSHELESPLKTPELSGSGFDLGYDPTQVLLTWRASARPFRKKNRSYYTTAGILIFIVILILILAGERLLIGVLLALGFLAYVISFVEPQEVDYRISAQGLTIGDHFYHWQELDSFWFAEKEGFKTLNILTNIHFPGMLILVLGPEINDVKRVCAKYLPFHEIAPRSFIDKWGERLQKNFPLEHTR